MSNRWVRIFVATVCLSFGALSTQATPAVRSVDVVAPQIDRLRAVRKTFLQSIEAGKFPSLAIGVARGNSVLWLEGLGDADREAHIAATPDTVYPIASVSKSITATLAAILVQRGKIGWNDKIARRVSGIAPGVTLRELVEQTSGIPHLWWYEFAAAPDSTLKSETLISAARTTAFPPGKGFIYSNLNFELAARYMGAAKGEPYPAIAKRELWEPLGMQHTTDDEWVGRPPATAGYQSNGRVPFVYRLGPRGGAGLFSSARDLLRFAQFQLGVLPGAHSLLSAASLADIHGDDTPAGRFGYSHGWGRIEFGKSDFALLSDGQMLGGCASILLLPKHQLAVVMLTNRNTDIFEAEQSIVDAIEPGLKKSLSQGLQNLEARWSVAGTMPTGTFSGSLDLKGAKLALQLDFDAKPGPTLKMGDGRPRALSDLEWDRGMLEASVAGDLPLSSDRDRSHELDLALHLGTTTIDGFATDALSDDAQHEHFGLPYPLRLAKAQGH